MSASAGWIAVLPVTLHCSDENGGVRRGREEVISVILGGRTPRRKTGVDWCRWSMCEDHDGIRSDGAHAFVSTVGLSWDSLAC